MKLVYAGTRLQVNGAAKVAIMHCNILHSLGHDVRFAVLGTSSLDWGNPMIAVEYVTSFRRVTIEERELIVALDCFSANWFTGQYGMERVISLIQTDEPKLYMDEKLIQTAQTAFRLPNPKIAVSKYLHEVLLLYGSDSYIIPPAAEESVFYAEDRMAPETGKPFRVLTVGSYGHPLKQIPEAFRALEYLKSRGVNVLLTRLVRKEEEETPENIKTLWHVNPPRQEIGKIYRSVDALLFPSSSEGFGLPILEAMMSGIPFVATNNGGSRELVPESIEELLVDVGDIRAMGEALYRLAKDGKHWQRLKALGLAKAKQWSWEKTGSNLEKYLQTIYKNVF